MAKTSTTRATATPPRRAAPARKAAPKVSATKAEVLEILFDTQKKLLEAETAVAARAETIMALESELAAARGETDRFETAAYAAQVEIRILEGARDVARARLAEARTEVLELTRMLAAIQQDRVDAEQRIAALTAERAALTTELAEADQKTESHLEALRRDLAEARSTADQLPTLKQTVDRQEQQLASRAQEMVELSRLLSEAEDRAGDSTAALHNANAWIAPLLGPFLSHPSGTPFSDEECAEYAARIVANGAFDPEWYNLTNPDVAESGTDPALHFLQYGLAEGRAPRDLSAPRPPADAE